MTKVKICGVTRPGDAELAAELGAWAIGLNHFEGSRRRCDPTVAAEIGATLKRRCEVAGVFVNSTLEEITAAAEAEQLTIVQLHGDEGAQFCAEVARRTGCKVMKAMPVRSAADIRAAEAYRTDYHLLDTAVRGQRGGTGRSFDWELVRGRRSQVPMVLAGGLTPENTAEAIEVAAPYAIDVASGVESEPGIKDRDRMEALFEAAGVSAAGVEAES